MLDLRRLQIFVTVAEQGSFTSAARALYLTQSAVSQQMSVLEHELGVNLLNRQARGVELTDSGRLLAERSNQLLADISALEAEIKSVHRAKQVIRLGSFASAAADLLPYALRHFLQRQPDVDVRVQSVQPDTAMRDLRDGTFDVLLRWDYNFAPLPLDPAFCDISLPDDPLLAVLPVGHRLAARETLQLRELAQDRWVVRAHAAYPDAYETMCRIAGFIPDIVFRAESYHAAQGLVAAGIGVSLAPRLSLRSLREGVVARPLTSPTLARRVTVVARRHTRPSSVVGELITTLTQVAAEILGQRLAD